jgi:hypothetical protein
MMERLDAIGFAMMNSLCNNCFQIAKYALARNEKSPPSEAVGREINYLLLQ